MRWFARLVGALVARILVGDLRWIASSPCGARRTIARWGSPLHAWMHKHYTPAMTWGDLVIFADPNAVQHTAHELAHVEQWRRWGPLLPVMWVLGAAWCLLRRRSLVEHPLEQAAIVAAGRQRYADAQARR